MPDDRWISYITCPLDWFQDESYITCPPWWSALDVLGSNTWLSVAFPARYRRCFFEADCWFFTGEYGLLLAVWETDIFLYRGFVMLCGFIDRLIYQTHSSTPTRVSDFWPTHFSRSVETSSNSSFFQKKILLLCFFFCKIKSWSNCGSRRQVKVIEWEHVSFSLLDC